MPVPFVVIAEAVVGVLELIGQLGPIRRGIEYTANAVQPNVVPPEAELADGAIRSNIDADSYYEQMKLHGYNEGHAALFYANRHALMDTAQLIDALRRGVITGDDFTARMFALGWDKNDIEPLLDQSLFFPSPTDLITMEAKSVFRPDIVDTFNLADEFNTINLGNFAKAGMSEEQVKNYWIAHWQPPAYTSIRDFVHWGFLDPNTAAGQHFIDQWFREAAVPPFWRDKYLGTIYEPLTRVDLRRMRFLEVIGDSDVITGYKRLGYSDADANNLLIFTKLQQFEPELRRRYQNGWLTEDQLRAELIGYGLEPNRAERILQTLIKSEDSANVGKVRELTKAEVLNGYKRDVLSAEQATELLLRLHYTKAEAAFELAVTELGKKGGTKSYVEHLSLVYAYLDRAGEAHKSLTPELAAADLALSQAQDALKQAQDAQRPAGELDALQQAVNAASYTYEQLLAQWQALA